MNKEADPSCGGQHHFFVINDAVYKGVVYVFLACTKCGEGKILEFKVADADAVVEMRAKSAD